MITGTSPVGEINETVTMVQNTTVTDEIKRNHLQSQEIEKFSEKLKTTEFAEKFARLKKSLRKRSSNIF